MTETSSFTIVCSKGSKHYEFRGKFIDNLGNIRITDLPREYTNGKICHDNHCNEDVHVDNRQIHLLTDSSYLTFRVIGYDFRGIEYNNRVAHSQ